MPANFSAILLELHRRSPWRFLRRGLVCLALWASLVFIVDILRPSYSGCGKTRRATESDVLYMVRVIEQFQLQQQDRCPRDVAELKSAGVVSRIQKDPWGRPFVIECSDRVIRVCSHGPDEADPEDDVCHEEHPYVPTPVIVNAHPVPREPDPSRGRLEDVARVGVTSSTTSDQDLRIEAPVPRLQFCGSAVLRYCDLVDLR